MAPALLFIRFYSEQRSSLRRAAPWAGPGGVVPLRLLVSPTLASHWGCSLLESAGLDPSLVPSPISGHVLSAQPGLPSPG